MVATYVSTHFKTLHTVERPLYGLTVPQLAGLACLAPFFLVVLLRVHGSIGQVVFTSVLGSVALMLLRLPEDPLLSSLPYGLPYLLRRRRLHVSLTDAPTSFRA